MPAKALAADLFEDSPRLERQPAAPAPLITSAKLLAFGAELDHQAAARDFFALDIEGPER